MGSSIAGTCRILIKQFDGPSKTSKHTGEGQRMDAFRLVQIVNSLHDEVPPHGNCTSVRVRLAFLGFPLQVTEELRGVEQSGSSSGS